MRIKITAGGIHDGEGKEIKIGTELDVADPEVGEDGEPLAPHPWAGRFEVISGSRKAKKAVTNPKGGDEGGEPPAGPFTVEDGGSGWWSILDAKGEKVGKGLREDDAKAFDTLSDEDKAAFAAEHAKA